MLQEEEDAQATLNNPGGQTGTAKKGLGWMELKHQLGRFFWIKLG
jgi:hypothetical protein